MKKERKEKKDKTENFAKKKLTCIIYISSHVAFFYKKKTEFSFIILSELRGT